VSRRSLLLLLLVLACAWFGTLGIRPLYKADESRYAEIPREMVASGDWITPRLNGFKYFEKPPLQYWGTAVLFEVLGIQDWVARLWAAATGFAAIVLVYFVARRMYSAPAGVLAAAILAGSPLYVLLGQVTTLDMGVSFFLSLAVFAFALGHPMVFWAACALAVLSKGLIGIVLPLAAVGLYILIKRDWALIRAMRPVAGGLLFLAIAAPWFIAVSMANSEFLHFFFVQEHFQRFTSEVHHRGQPAWYFVPVLLAGIAPWILPFLFTMKRTWRSKGGRAAFEPNMFLGLWVLVVFVFFSASGSKLPSYILPIFPPLAVLIGGWLAAEKPHRLLAVQAGLAVVVALALALLLPRLAAGYADYVPWLVTAAVVAAVFAAIALVLAWRGALQPSVLALAAGAILCTQVALIGHRALAPLYSAQGLIDSVAPIPPDAPVFAVDAYDHTLPWYLGRTVTMVRYTDELAKAIEWEPHKFLPDHQAFARAWSAERSAFAFIAVRDFEQLRSELPMKEESRDPRYVLVRKP
jgi:4-amino-4-deoxy-L-arabinose transferase-like glycosyltransferase